ncbi:MAG TPA: response regulator [Vicinamibacterales bacterium]|nr:response regulator [Vicinamibacterales bacterium]
MPRRPILIIDDDPGAAEAFVPMLRTHGYDVTAFGAAEAALEEIERRLPMAVLVDLHLPTIDGLEFVRRVRSNREHSDLPIAMMTADYFIDDRVTDELQTLGVSLHFKPLWEPDLVNVVERLTAAPGIYRAAGE